MILRWSLLMHLNGFRSPAAPSPLARQRYHMTASDHVNASCGMGWAVLASVCSTACDECSQKGSFFFRGKGLCIVSQLSHFPSIPFGHCGALSRSLGCTSNWFPVCNHIVLAIFLVREEAAHSKATGSVV